SSKFIIDIVLYERSTNKVLYILDIKYKTPLQPAAEDIAQVIAYAVSKNSQEAVLVYPINIKNSLDEFIGNIRVRSLTFSLDGDLEQAGETFLQKLQFLSN
ncbi:MAG: restriction endonuclease, partial [Phormidium sp.]